MMKCPYDGAEIVRLDPNEKKPSPTGEWYRCCESPHHYFKAEWRRGRKLLADMADNVVGEVKTEIVKQDCGHTPQPRA